MARAGKAELRVLCVGLPREFCDHTQLAVDSGMDVVRAHAATVGGLQLELATNLPRIIVLPGTWLRDFGLNWLAELRQFNPAPEFVVVGGQLSAGTVAHLIPLGFRGHLPSEALPEEIAMSIRKVLAGELWLSRRLILAVMRTLSAHDPEEPSGTWKNLVSLTEREHSVLDQILQGRSNKEVANALLISEQTVKVHLQHIYHKLGVHRRAELLLARM